MKKILAIALVMILALSLLTACGGNDNGGGISTNPPASNNGGNNNGGNNNGGNNNTNDDKPDMSLTEYMGGDWPTAYLPKDMPEYDEGIRTVTAKPGDVGISYFSHDPLTKFDAYLDALKNDGWKVEETVEGMGTATKGKWEITYAWGDKNASLFIKYDS